MSGTNVFSLLGKLAIDGVDESKKALDEVSKSGEDTKKKLSVSFKELGEEAGKIGKTIAVGLAGIGAGALAAVEGTREFRQDLGKLKTTFGEGTDGLGVEAGTQAFKDLFAVLGEDDTAIEAANHLGVMVDSEQALNEWTNILTGVYATFGDSLPLEGLAEAANETARVGSVTGGLADALNWVGVSEDEFNEKLEKCNNTAEREALIRTTLTDLYGYAADEYKNINSGVMENNKAQAELNLKMAETAEKIEPIITQGKILLAEILLKLQPVITWVIDNIDILGPIILTVVGALTLFSTTMSIVNAVMLASPVTWIVLAIVAALAALVAIIIVVVKNWDDIKKATTNAINKMKDAVSNGIDKIKGFFEKIINFVKENWQGLLLLLVNPFAGAFKLLYDNCEGFRNFVDNFVKKIKDFFINGFNAIKNGVTSIVTNLTDGVKNKFNAFKDGVSNIFNKVKDAITKPIDKARETIKGIIDKIKGIFDFKWSLPHLNLPHIKVTGGKAPYGIGGKGSLPKFNIEWYAKAMDNPMILDQPTAFGISPSGAIRAGGEAGSELVGGTNTIMGMISDAVSSNNGGMEAKLDKLISLLANYLPSLSNQQVVLSTGELVGALTSPLDKSLGQLASDRRRGR